MDIREQLRARGISPIVGVVLVVAVTLLLAFILFLLTSQFSATSAATVASVEVDTSQRTAFIRLNGVNPNADELEIVVDGTVERTWQDLTAGSELPLFCLQPGDDIVVRQRNDDGRTLVVAQHEMETRSACRFDVEQGSDEYTVTPINWQNPGASPDSFYSYGRGPNGDGTGHYHAHLDPGFTAPNESYMFFYEFDGEVALIFVNDNPDGGHGDHSATNAVDGSDNYDDTAGGAVDLNLTGEPSEASWVVQDDANDFDAGRNGNNGCSTYWDVCWDWTQTNTDGGILAGGFSGDLSDLEIMVEIQWNDDADHWERVDSWTYRDMEEWVLYSGTDDGSIRREELDMSQNATITIADG